jgi:hypothetical protein
MIKIISDSCIATYYLWILEVGRFFDSLFLYRFFNTVFLSDRICPVCEACSVCKAIYPGEHTEQASHTGQIRSEKKPYKKTGRE